MAQLITLPLTVSCFSKIQIGFTFLVLAHTGNPGQRAVKRVCVCIYIPHEATPHSLHFYGVPVSHILTTGTRTAHITGFFFFLLIASNVHNGILVMNAGVEPLVETAVKSQV